MAKFEQKTEAWTDSRLDQSFLAVRREIMTTAPGNIITRSNNPLVYAHAPFTSSNYPYLDRIKAIPWDTIVAQNASELIEPDPHAPSKFRKHGYACWDAAVGIPASNSRSAKIVRTIEVPIIRDTNMYWAADALPALEDVGPTGTPGIYRRPTGEYIVDFMKIDNGWFYLELAHALSHITGDTADTAATMAKGVAAIRKTDHMQHWVAKIAVALLFDLPLDTMPDNTSTPGTPDFPCVNLAVQSSSQYDKPILSIPWNNSAALMFDETLAVMAVGVFIQPHPFGFITGTLNVSSVDRWSCMPTLAVIAGWECIDVITHQPLVQRVPHGNLPVCYGVHPRDLLAPELFWGYLQLWRKQQRAVGRMDVPKSDGRRYMRLPDFMFSPRFDHLFMCSPSLPCQMCMLWNRRTDGTPERPFGIGPKNKAELKQHKNWKWRLYAANISAVFKLIEQATIIYETKLYGSETAKQIRRVRKRNWKAKLQLLRQQGYVTTARLKIKQGKTLTKWEARAYKAWKQLQH